MSGSTTTTRTVRLTVTTREMTIRNVSPDAAHHINQEINKEQPSLIASTIDLAIDRDRVAMEKEYDNEK